MTLFHGAGSNCESALMIAVAEAFCKAGYLVFRGDLPFRQHHPQGPPRGNPRRDQEGIRRAAEELRRLAAGIPLCLAGHSYGGRQSTIVAAGNTQENAIADALLLLSYPLHQPGHPDKPRTEHFPAIRVPALFVHGTRDPFGTIDELKAALKLIPAPTKLITVEGAGHGVPPKVAETLPPSLSEWLPAILRK